MSRLIKKSLSIYLCITICLLTTSCTRMIYGKQTPLASITPITLNIPVGYIDAYANIKQYYGACVARKSMILPNGQYTIPVSVKTLLDRDMNRAELAVFLGPMMTEFLKFRQSEENSTIIEYYVAPPSGLFKNTLEKKQHQQIKLIETVAQQPQDKCL